MNEMNDGYQITVERDDVFTRVEVREGHQRVAYYTIENQYAPGVVTALRTLLARDEEPLFATEPDCLWPEHCRKAGHCALDCRGE